MKKVSPWIAWPLLSLLFGSLMVLGIELRQLNRIRLEVWRRTDDLQALQTRFTVARQALRQADDELTFLHNLADVVPQEKGYLRTHQAIVKDVDALRYKVSRYVHDDLHILVDTQANKLYVKRGLTLLWQADCSVGRGGMLTDKATGRRWEFVTPHGQFEIREKVAQPLWIKPDWAFVESGEKVPPPNDPVRAAKDELGAFVMTLGDGYLIHGTKNETLLGRPASHGCVRLGRTDLERLYQLVPKGTRVFIY